MHNQDGHFGAAYDELNRRLKRELAVNGDCLSDIKDATLRRFAEDKAAMVERARQELIYLEQTEAGAKIMKLRQLQETFGKNEEWREVDIDRFLDRYFAILDDTTKVT